MVPVSAATPLAFRVIKEHSTFRGLAPVLVMAAPGRISRKVAPLTSSCASLMVRPLLAYRIFPCLNVLSLASMLIPFQSPGAAKVAGKTGQVSGTKTDAHAVIPGLSLRLVKVASAASRAPLLILMPPFRILITSEPDLAVKVPFTVNGPSSRYQKVEPVAPAVIQVRSLVVSPWKTIASRPFRRP